MYLAKIPYLQVNVDEVVVEGASVKRTFPLRVHDMGSDSIEVKEDVVLVEVFIPPCVEVG